MLHQRPVKMNEHPIATKKYIVPTPSIDELVARVKKIVRLRIPGGIIYALPRYGKTYGIRYVIYELRAEYPDAVCISFGCEKKKSPSEDAFFFNLLAAAGHRGAAPGSVTKKRARLIERICELVDRSSHNWVVFFADEAQRLESLEYNWLHDVHNELERKGIRMITILVGQPQLLNRKSSFIQGRETQIVLRFMLDEMRFDGIRSPEDIATCLGGYDIACYPEGTDWTFTRFYYPEAVANGMSLEHQAGPLWDAFLDAHNAAGFGFDMEIPMQYFAHAVEIALEENSKHDCANFIFSRAMWDEAVKDCAYVAAQQALQDGMPDVDVGTDRAA
ncbi:ATP-binding protein [Massilia sp. P8910]|uniref:ATP-binding protein n=1 Tax=Massilia antarctica TaxID=2765360 RepID=UPI001E3654F9|nr:ATP-binding protein [Massilia antarctica]MCE3602817.1 ATP-binding protein [Massilia antarctica]